jgi:elongation factor Ts
MADEVKITAEQVKALREATGAGMMDCKRALQETGGDAEQAKEWLRKKGMASAAKRAARTATEGVIEAYIHFNARVGVLVELNCETDFVANTPDFRQLAKDIALHIASSQTVRWVTRDQIPESELEAERGIYEAQAREQGKPENVIERIVTGKLEAYYRDVVLVDQPFVKDPDRTVGELIDGASGKLGEKVQVRRFVRFRLGEEAI